MSDIEAIRYRKLKAMLLRAMSEDDPCPQEAEDAWARAGVDVNGQTPPTAEQFDAMCDALPEGD